MSRINKFKKYMVENNISSYFIGDISNVYYLSGFTGSTAFILITEDKNILISDGRYELQIAEEVGPEFSIYIVTDYLEAFKDLTASITSLYVDPGCSLSNFNSLSGTTSTNVDMFNIAATLRVIKDEHEIIMIKDAYRIAGKAFENMLNDIKFEMTENHWAASLEYHMKVLGADSLSFDTITASGIRGALPHGLASEKKIDSNEPVIIDYGCKKKYCSDITRVIFNGKDPFVNDIIDIVHTALNNSINDIKPGAKCSDIDKVARDYIEMQGFGDYFNHGLGHGVGIDVHEFPRFSMKDDSTLESGMVITVEPGIYLPGRFGIRLEDTVLVTENGCEILSAVLDKHVYTL